MARGSHFWSCFGHARGKSWFPIVFYSILEPRAPVETVSFLDFFVFFVNFMSWRACGLYLMRECFFQSLKTKILISYCFLQHFGAVGTSRKGVFFRHFSVFVVDFMSRWACGLHSMRECFFKHSKRKSWFRIVFYNIFEPWAPLEKVTFLDVFQFFFVIFMSWWARGLNLFYEWPKTTPR